MAHEININVNLGQGNSTILGLVEATNKLNATVAQLQAVIVEYGNKTSASNEKAKKSLTDYTGSYSNLKQVIAASRIELQKELDILAALRRSRALDSDEVTKQVEKVKLLEAATKAQVSALSQYNKALGIAKTQSQQATSTMGALTNGFNTLGAVLGVSFGLYGALRGLTSTIKNIAEFDLAVHKLRSILGETAAGMKDITQSAIDVGKASIFGATGVVGLQIELAKMGFAKGEIIAMQQAIVNLATATQEELAPSAEVVANIIRAFGLSAGQATMVVDVMGKAFNDSALDLGNFREAIKYVAPVAKQANFTFQETTALLEALSNAGIKGSLAGTGLTNILSRLGNENSKFVKTLGHTVEGFDGFIAGMIELKNRGVDLTGVFQLVDRRAAATFSILLEGVDTVEQFKQKLIDSNGVMEQQTAVQLESITFKARLLKESWKAMILEMDSGNGTISETIKWFINLGDAMVTAMSNPADAVEKTADNIQRTMTSIQTMVDQGWVELNAADKDRYATSLKDGRIYYASLTDIVFDYMQKLEKIKSQGTALMPFRIAALKNELKTAVEELNKDFPSIVSGLSSLKQETIDAATKPYVDTFLELAKSSGNAGEAFKIQIGRLLQLKEAYAKNADKLEVIKSAINKVNDAYKRISDFEAPDSGGEDKAKKAAKDKMDLDVLVLENKKKLAAAAIELANQVATKELESQVQVDTAQLDTTTGDAKIALLKKIAEAKDTLALRSSEKATQLTANEFKYDVLIANRKQEFERIYSDNKEAAEIKFNLEIELMQINHQIKMNEISGKGNDDILKRQAELKKSLLGLEIQDLENAKKHASTMLGLDKQIAEERIKLRLKGGKEERAILLSNYAFDEQDLNDNYIAEIEIAKKKGEDTLRITEIYLKRIKLLEEQYMTDSTGVLKKKDQLNPNNQSLGEALGKEKGSDAQIAIDYAFEKTKDGLKSLVDAWVDATDKIVEARKRAVDEAQSSLDTEIQLAQAGFASNVTLKRKELQEAKRMQAEALVEQKKAQKIQAQVDLATQISSLAVAAANTFKVDSGLGPWGIPIAIAMIGTMLATFAAYKIKMKAISAPVLEEGGWIKGKRHTQGGTIVEAEEGEFVINRRSATKHRTIIEAINKDDQVTIDRVYMNKMKNGVLRASVSLDESEDLKAIRRVLEQKGKTIEYHGNYRIERFGNNVTKILMN